MKVSIFTPTHDPKYLLELYQSIKDQPFDEWIIVANGKKLKSAKKKAEKLGPFQIFEGSGLDSRVQVVWYDGPAFVGALKRFACEHCTGDILVEVDHDDILLHNAIIAIRGAFEDPEVGFVYSDDARFRDTFGPNMNLDTPFLKEFGWENYTQMEDVHGNKLIINRMFEPTPASVSKIWYAPDHIRAWRASVYWKAGGHPADMRVLDDQDLMCRTYLHTKFEHIPTCLYLYRITGENTWLKYNDEIQNNVQRVSNIYMERMALKWAKDNDLLSLDLGGRFNPASGYSTVDLKDADYVCDLNGTWDFPDSSVGVIRAFDIFEHLPDRIHTMKELSRVLAPGGYAFVQVPSTDGRGAFQDPTHVSYWNENSFLYYTDGSMAKYIDTPVRFQAETLYTSAKDFREVCWVNTTLISMKDGYRPPGRINI
jgi:glycosyltransferase involved in cell wall biosynthesis